MQLRLICLVGGLFARVGIHCLVVCACMSWGFPGGLFPYDLILTLV